MAGRIQKEDIKTEAELIGLGASASSLPQASQIYVSTLSKTLEAAITDGDIGGSAPSGGSFIWNQPDSGGPNEGIGIGGIKLFLFDNIDTQSVFAFVQVPSGYEAGTQIFLTGLSAFAASSANAFMRTKTYLFTNGTSMTALGNSHLSTTVQQALTANQLKVFPDIQLTDATGEIDSVSVQPGDFLLVEMFRDLTNETGGVAGDVSVISFSSSPKFGA
jgi:hypothetical protein